MREHSQMKTKETETEAEEEVEHYYVDNLQRLKGIKKMASKTNQDYDKHERII